MLSIMGIFVMHTQGTTRHLTGLPKGRAALLIAHPGHELRIHGWLERARPVVHVLTDGGGSQGHSRLRFTTQILLQTGATAGSLYGDFADAEIYEAILDRRYGLFIELAEKLSESLREEQLAYLVSDPTDGYNPSHDLCRILADTATRLASNESGRAIARYDYLQIEHPNSAPGAEHTTRIDLQLSEAEFARKMEAACSYTPLRAEMERLISLAGLQGFRAEQLRAAGEPFTRQHPQSPPYYEVYGERRVAAGAYPRVLRYEEHMVPLMQALEEAASLQRLCAPK